MAINKILIGGKAPDDPIEAAKRKVFLIGTPVGVLSILAVWGIGLKQNNIMLQIFLSCRCSPSLFLCLTILYWREDYSSACF